MKTDWAVIPQAGPTKRATKKPSDKLSITFPEGVLPTPLKIVNKKKARVQPII